MAKRKVTLVGIAYSEAKTSTFGVLGPDFRRCWVKTTVLDYYVTKKQLIDIT